MVNTHKRDKLKII